MAGFARLLAYWRAEQRTIRQGFLALLVATAADLVAGITLGHITGTLEALPGLLVMVPAAIAARGNVFGIMGSRLGTSIHAGLFEPTRKREGILYQNLYAAAVLTLATSVVLAVLAKTLAQAFGIESISVLDFVVISVLGGALASVPLSLFVVVLGVRSHRSGWDLDSVAAPVLMATGDAVTVPALFAATLLVGISWVTPVVAALLLVLTAVLAIRGLLTDLPLTGRIIRESLLVLTAAAVLDILAGLVIESRVETFLAFPVLLILIPPMMNNAGGLGGILSSRLASKLHLGVIEPRGLPGGPARLDFSLMFLIAAAAFPTLGVTVQLLGAALGLASPGLLKVVGVSVVAGFIATTLAVVVAYYAATVTFRLGMDPDNQGIPLVSGSMDFVGAMAVTLAVLAFGLA